MCKENQYDAFPSLKCRDCIYCNIRADLDGKTVDSHCPINHKEVKLSRPWFASYDVGNGHICKNFAPSRLLKWLYDRWEGLDRYYADMGQILRSDGYSDTQIHRYLPPFNTTLSLNLNNNNDIRYGIDMNDYFNCNVNEETNISIKNYMKQTRTSPYGYKRVVEKDFNKTIGDILSKKEV